MLDYEIGKKASEKFKFLRYFDGETATKIVMKRAQTHRNTNL